MKEDLPRGGPRLPVKHTHGPQPATETFLMWHNGQDTAIPKELSLGESGTFLSSAFTDFPFKGKRSKYTDITKKQTLMCRMGDTLIESADQVF